MTSDDIATRLREAELALDQAIENGTAICAERDGVKPIMDCALVGVTCRDPNGMLEGGYTLSDTTWFHTTWFHTTAGANQLLALGICYQGIHWLTHPDERED
jgi:hypothetical protein